MKRKVCFMFVNEAFSAPQRTLIPVGEKGEMIVVGVGNYGMACQEAEKQAEEGVLLLELCGGFGTIGQAMVTEAVNGKCQVGAVRFDNHPGYGGQSGDAKWR